ncbi:MAG: Do family serine endopeptidase [Myxococcota bacterium]
MKIIASAGLGILIGVAIGVWGPLPVRSQDGPEADEALTAESSALVGGASSAAAVGRERTIPPDLLDEASGHSVFARLAKKAARGVVNVHTSKTVVQQPFSFPFPELFREFFGQRRRGRPNPHRPEPRRFTVPSLGTGFVISKDGDILTNNHVVDGVDRITVIFVDGRESSAEIVGQDPKTDIALIRVTEGEDLQPLVLGDSDTVLPGDWVVAIGNPFGLDHTVTAGIVSAKGRDIGQGPYDDYIQTDAAINPGNSGGPLLDLSGAVVGINTAINPQANTIGFAVPINMAKEILPQLRENGHVVRGWLGVMVQPITPELAEAFELERPHGALVAGVSPDSPAEDAGFERGDVIVRFGDREIRKMRELPRAVSATPPGRKVEVEVIRDGRRKKLEVEIGELEAVETRAHSRHVRGGATAFGLRLQDLGPGLRQRLGTDVRNGAVVVELDPDGAAARAGIREGDIVIEIEHKPVESAEEAEKRLRDAERRALLLVRRGDATLFFVLERPEG